MRRKSIQKTKRSRGSHRIKSHHKKIKIPKDQPALKEKLFSRDMGLKDNYKNLNITYDVNIIDQLTRDHVVGLGQKGLRRKKAGGIYEDGEGHALPTIDVDEEWDLEKIQKVNNPVNDAAFSKSKPKITEDEAKIIEKLVKKYGENWERMKWDIKINKLQWNENQIQKKYDNYIRKFGNPANKTN